MPYILIGTRLLLDYRRQLGRPCSRDQMANAIKTPCINLQGSGRDQSSKTIQYGEVEAQSLAACLGVTVQNVTDNGGQILI